MNNQLFRKEALTRIESPERLNEMVNITSSRSWLMISAISGIVIAFILWSIFGELPYTINGQGILLQPGGVIEISAIAPGRISKTLINEGDIVDINDIVAYVDQYELEMKISNAKNELNDINSKYFKISEFGYENLELKGKMYEKENIGLKNAIDINNEKLNFLKERIKSQEELLSKGLITKENLNSTKNEYFNIQQDNDRLFNRQKEIQQKIFEIKEQNEIEINKIKSEILSVENKIRELQSEFNLNSVIRSPYNGKIIELMVNPGKVIEAGSPIASVEPLNIEDELQAILYINPKEGKKIEQGMKVKVSPSTIEVEEYGYIKGTVEKVSEYPSSFQGMLRTLGNLELVKSFTSEGPPIAIKVLLERDSTNYSGYAWTSKIGPDLKIKSGTLCYSKIIVETKTPISLLFPKLFIKNTRLDDIQYDSTLNSSINEFNPLLNLDTISINDYKHWAHSDSMVYVVQIAATKRVLRAQELLLLYNGDRNVKEEFIDGWYKYIIGSFNTKEDAINFIKESNLINKAFVRPVNKSKR